MKNNLYRRGKSWYVRFRVGKRRHNISLGNDFDRAKLSAAQIIAEKRGVKEGSIFQDVGWHGFRGKYLEERKTIKKRATYYFDRRGMDLLQQEFPIQRLEDVTPSLLQTFQSRLKSQKRSNIDVNRYVRAISKAMKQAEEWDLIKPQRWARVRKLKEPSGKLRYLTVEECQSILKSLTGVWLTGAYVGIRAGLRREELHTLSWENVSFEQSMIRVEAFEGWAPKGYQGRSIPMSADLKSYLQSIARPHGFVLGDNRPSLDRMTYMYPRLFRKLGIYRASIHTTRHTFGAHLAIAGVNARKIQELMGHADIKTTQIYMHLSPESIRDSVDKLPEFNLKLVPA